MKGVNNKQATVRFYQEKRPSVKLIGFDSTQSDKQSAMPIPLLKKQKSKRKKSASLPITPAPPQHPGVALAVALILTLGAAGWLLGERKPRPQPAA